jgi:hypothetical protein
MNVTIFGSCVTRDIFDFVEENESVYRYFARSSVVSVVSKPIKINLEEINLKSSFQKRIVYYDLNPPMHSVAVFLTM